MLRGGDRARPRQPDGGAGRPHLGSFGHGSPGAGDPLRGPGAERARHRPRTLRAAARGRAGRDAHRLGSGAPVSGLDALPEPAVRPPVPCALAKSEGRRRRPAAHRNTERERGRSGRMQPLRRQAGADPLGPGARRRLSRGHPLALSGPRRCQQPGAAPMPPRLDAALPEAGGDRNRPHRALRPLRIERPPAVGRAAADTVSVPYLATALDARAPGPGSRNPGPAGGDQRRPGALGFDPNGAGHSPGIAHPPGNGDRPPLQQRPEPAEHSGCEEPAGAQRCHQTACARIPLHPGQDRGRHRGARRASCCATPSPTS